MRKEARDGPQMDIWACAFKNETPLAASLSRFVVPSIGSNGAPKEEITGLKSSARSSKTLGVLKAIVGDSVGACEGRWVGDMVGLDVVGDMVG